MKLKNILSLALVTVVTTCSVLTPINADAYSTTSVSASKLSSGTQFTFTGMPYNGKNSPISTYNGKKLTIHTVQNFAYTPDGKYVFTTAQCETSSSKMHTLLTRTIKPSSTGKNATAEFAQAHVLNLYGHGETLDISQPDKSQEIYNIWVACTPKSTIYGTEIARLTYEVDEDGNGSITKTVIIKNFNKANVSGGKAKTFSSRKVQRLGVSISTTGKQIMFRLKFQDGSGANFVAYDFDKLNAALDNVKNGKKYDIAKAAKWQQANVRNNTVPTDTFQSFATDGKNIYVCGGHFNLGASIYVIPYKSQKNGKTSEQNKDPMSNVKKKINIATSLKINGKSYTKKTLEIEGMKIKKNGSKLDFYINFYPNGCTITDSISVYKFTK